MPRPITTDEPLGEPLGEDVDNDSDDNIFIKGMSDILIVCNLLLLLFLLLTVKLRFQESSQTSNLTIQPPLSPGHLKEGRYLVLKVGVIDRGE